MSAYCQLSVATVRIVMSDAPQQQALPEEMLSTDGVLKMTTFLRYAPRFKDDIILIMDANSPIDIPPLFLPSKISTLLAMLCELSDEGVEKLWSLLKDVVWNWAAEMQTIDERYHLFGGNLGYR